MSVRGIEPGSAEDRAGRLREEDKSDELEVFELRRRWLQEFHTDRLGSNSDLLFEQAVSHAVALESLPPPSLWEFSAETPSEPSVRVAEFRDVEGAEPGPTVRPVDNPAPNASLGFASETVGVTFDESEWPSGVNVTVQLNPDVSAGVDLGTVRVMRFDEEIANWVLVPRSGVSGDLTHAWVRAHRPGLYVAVGLPVNPVLLNAVAALRGLEPSLEAAARLDAIQPVAEALSTLAFAGGRLQSLGGDDVPEALGEFGGFDAASRAGGLDVDGFRNLIASLDLANRRPVEFELLDDLARSRASAPELAPRAAPDAIVALQGWSSIGPNNVNGRIKSIAVHPTNANIVWAGAANGGVWMTTDGGASWKPKWFTQLSLAVGAIAVAPSNPSVLYAATGEDTPGWAPSWSGIGVYKSGNGGSTWTLLATIASNRCTRVVVHPTDPNTVYVAGNAGLHRSTNGGSSWTNVRGDHVSDVLLDPNNPNRLYAGVWNSGVYRSTDAGTNWTLLSNGIPTGASADWIKLAMGKNGAHGTNFLIAKMAQDSGTIYRSRDGGNSWSMVATGVEPASYNEWTNMIGVDPRNEDVIIAGGVGLSRSTNGSTFGGVGGTHSDHHQVAWSVDRSPECPSVLARIEALPGVIEALQEELRTASPSQKPALIRRIRAALAELRSLEQRATALGCGLPATLYLATDGGVYKSTNNGATWALASYGLIATQLYSIGVSQSATFRAGGGTQDQGIIQTSGPLNWVDTGAGNEGGFFVVDPNNASVIYTTPWSGALRRSTDGGATWTSLTPPANPPSDVAVRFGDSNRLLAVRNNQIMASNDQGTNWSTVANVSGSALRIAISPSTPDNCYAATNDGRVYHSAAGGASGTWSEPYAPADKPPNGTIAAIAISHANGNRLFIGYAGFGLAHVWRSTDGGAHWTNASGTGVATLPDIPVNALVIHHLNPDVVYAATDIGVFRTADGGATWGSFNLGLPRAFVSGLVLRKTTKRLYASTMGRGAWTFDVSSP